MGNSSHEEFLVQVMNLSAFLDFCYSFPNISRLCFNITYRYFPFLNSSAVEPALDAEVERVALYTTSFLIAFCVLSLAVNVSILLSVCFIRTKVSPTLYISLSLAGADTLSLFLFALSLVLFTLLPRAFNTFLEAHCFSLLLEAIRMGAILTTMFHLLFLAANHYLGILLPLRYPLCVTKRHLRSVAMLLWFLPSALLIVNFFVLQDPGSNCTNVEFLKKEKFRTTFAIPFFTTLGLMMFIYCHIYILVERNRAEPLHGLNEVERSSSSSNEQRQQGSLTKSQVNRKAIKTTMMIMGSVVCGWLPVFTYYILVCEDCLLHVYFRRRSLGEHCFLVLINFLMISKTATNSYIYACRMKDIKIALKCMKRRVMTSIR